MKKIITKNNLMAFILGAITFGIINVSAQIVYDSGLISYNHNGTDITVSGALDELYDKANTSNLILIASNFTAPGGSYGTYSSKTIDVKGYLQTNNINIDYTKLTTDNFLLEVTKGEFETNDKLTAPSFAPEVTSYDPTTGILTIGKITYVWHQVVNNGYSLVKYTMNVYLK